MNRREFSRKVRVAAFERAQGRCERCTAKLAPGNIEYDHRLADWLGGEPTLENCAVLCRACHRGVGGKTASDAATIAKAKRVASKHSGAYRPRSTFATARSGGWRKPIHGNAVRRDDA